MPQDLHRRAIERYEDCKEAWRENHKRMREDLRFSNPADPQQWDREAQELRKGRVMLTMDRTNQFIVQVVNDGRRNKPGITTMPSEGGDVDVATQLDGVIRHIEYRSRAQIAYDTALEGAARCGVGWIRVTPRVVDEERNTQDIMIERVIDPLSIVIDGDEPDGSDAMNGFAETLMSKREFMKKYPKADMTSWESTDGVWTLDEQVRACEYQYVEETKANRLIVAAPDDGEQISLSEDEYWALAKQIGYQPQVVGQFMAIQRTVKWCTLSGSEVLEETEYPSKWLGMVPVYGFELYVDGKRHLCGMTRRLMDSQRAYNYERSAMVETVALQPRAPILVPIEAVEGHEESWKRLNSGSPAYLPFNSIDDDGNAILRPERLAPPAFPVAFAQGGQLAIGDMEASVGMYRANLGAPSNETSGRAIRERKEEGDTATFHFIDNLSRSVEQVGRIVVGMVPTLYDTKRVARILGVDGKHGQVTMDPGLQQPKQKAEDGSITAINPGIGSYDVRVIAGANYTTQRQEAAEAISQILQSVPNFAPVLAPALVKLRDFPESEKLSRMLLAMAPPEVQQIANEGQGQPEIPPQVRTQMQQMQQHMQQMTQMLDAGEKELQRLEQENQTLKSGAQVDAAKVQADAQSQAMQNAIAMFNAETQRLGVYLKGLDAANSTAINQASLAEAKQDESELS